MNESVFVHPSEARRRFEEFALRELTTDDLLEGALLIALEEYPRLDLDHYRNRVDALVSRVLERCREGEPDIFRLGHLHAVLFDEEGFIGNVGDYDDARNLFVNEVLDRKLGIQVSLTILFLTLARRVGLDAHPVGVPGHVLAKIQFELSEVYVDPFYGGQTLSIPELGEIVSEMSGGKISLRSEHLRAWDPRRTLAQMLAQIHEAFMSRGDTRRATAAAERMEILGASIRAGMQ